MMIGIEVEEMDDYKRDIDIKCESLGYDLDDVNSAFVSGFKCSTLAVGKTIKEEVEENEEKKKIDVKHLCLDYELERPAIENANENDEKQFECHECNFKSEDDCKGDPNQHIHEEKKEWFECYSCDYKSIRKVDLKRHILAIHEIEKAPVYACELCPFKTIYKGYMNRHIRNVHGEMTKQFECHKCSYKSKYKYALKMHIMSIHEKEKAPRYACEICSYRTIYKSSLNMHMRIHNEFSLECTFCQKSFTQKINLDAHYVSAHRDQSDSFKHLLTCKVNQCSECSYATVHKTTFKNHLLTHKKDRGKLNFECYACGYKCMWKTNLKRHVRLHAGQLPFACSECNKRFNMKQQLDGHIVSQHKENEQLMKSVTNKTYQCPKCTYITITSDHFKKHMKRHEDFIS